MLSCITFAFAYVALRVAVFEYASPVQFPDSDSYTTKAAQGILDPDFFFGAGRFFVVPLFYKGVGFVPGQQVSALTAAQLTVSITAWIVLAWATAAGAMTTIGRILGFVLVLSLGLTTDVLMWDLAILSESLSLSTFALLTAALLRLTQRSTKTTAACFSVMALLWSYTREANGILLLPLAVALACGTLWYTPRGHRTRSHMVTAVISCLLAVGSTTLISASGDRWVFPLLNVIGRRVLPSSERTAYYAAGGMPLTPRLLRMQGEFGSGQDFAFYQAPELETFRAWLHRDGRRVYGHDLLEHPVRSLMEPLRDADEFIDPGLHAYLGVGAPRLIPDVSQLMVRRGPGAVACLLASLATGSALFVAAWLERRRVPIGDGFAMLVPGAMLLGWLPWTWFTWHVIGEMEIGRHVLAGTMFFRVGVVLLVVHATDKLITSRTSSRPEAAVPEGRFPDGLPVPPGL